jgi:hypothetical protein
MRRIEWNGIHRAICEQSNLSTVDYVTQETVEPNNRRGNTVCRSYYAVPACSKESKPTRVYLCSPSIPACIYQMWHGMAWHGMAWHGIASHRIAAYMYLGNCYGSS